jgi:Ca-activated chloride channel family protein
MILTVLLCFVSYLLGQDETSSTPVFRVRVDTIFLKVAVTDSSNRFVTGLKATDFRVYEDNILQTISTFNQESGPVSIGFIMDVSYSMRYSLSSAKGWFEQMVEKGRLHPDDEYFLIVFNEEVRLVRSFSDEIEELENVVALQQPGGDTALVDAIYWGMYRCKNEGKNEKKALIVFTDGDDNNSRYSKYEVRRFAMESGVQVYILPMYHYGGPFLKDLALFTGGRAEWFGFRSNQDLIDRIHAELRNQYVLGYAPTNTARDGKWREIKVKLDTPPDFPKLAVNTKSGYYAPEN